MTSASAANAPFPSGSRFRRYGSGAREACRTILSKLMQSAAKRWRVLFGAPLWAVVIAGVVFKDKVNEGAA